VGVWLAQGVSARTVQRMLKRVLTSVISLGVFAALLANPSTRTIAYVVMVLLTMVAIHEGGHLIAARLCGVDAPEFSVGFGPEIVSYTPKSKKTKYALRAIPLGGFVRIKGLGVSTTLEGEDDPSRESQGLAYEEVSRPKRVFISAAGPLANVLSAVLLLLVVFLQHGEVVPSLTVRTAPSMPAAMAGIKDGETITAIDGKSISSWDEIAPFVKTASEKNAPLEFTLRKESGATHTVLVTPMATDEGPRVGVSPVGVRKNVSVFRATSDAVGATKDITMVTLSSFGNLGKSFISLPAQLAGASDDKSSRVVSPIGAAQLAEDSAKEAGWIGPVTLAASVSVFLALFNLLPLPPLDGSHIATATYEGVFSRIRRRPVRINQDFNRRLATLTTWSVLFMGVGALLLDILRPL
jgi:regulator of sigma E protease